MAAQPGKMLLVDLDEGRLIPDEELKATWRSHPYKEWLAHPDRSGGLAGNRQRGADLHWLLLYRQQAFGYAKKTSSSS